MIRRGLVCLSMFGLPNYQLEIRTINSSGIDVLCPILLSFMRRLRGHLKFNCADFSRRTPSGGGEGIFIRAAEFCQKIAELIYETDPTSKFFNILRRSLKKAKLVPRQAKIDIAFWGRNVECDAPVQVSVPHWQPRRNKNGVKQPDGYDLEAPLYSSNRNNFEFFMKSFAR